MKLHAACRGNQSSDGLVPYLVQAGVGDLGEVMVLVVVADVVGQRIQGTVVAICLLPLHHCSTTDPQHAHVNITMT